MPTRERVPFANQMMMQSGDRQQRGNRRVFGDMPRSDKNQNRRAVGDGLVRVGEKFFQRAFRLSRSHAFACVSASRYFEGTDDSGSVQTKSAA